VNSLSGLLEKVSLKIWENEEISNINLLANKNIKIKEIKYDVKKRKRMYNDLINKE
jgi:hypothetical protein